MTSLRRHGRTLAAHSASDPRCLLSNDSAQIKGNLRSSPEEPILSSSAGSANIRVHAVSVFCGLLRKGRMAIELHSSPLFRLDRTPRENDLLCPIVWKSNRCYGFAELKQLIRKAPNLAISGSRLVRDDSKTRDGELNLRKSQCDGEKGSELESLSLVTLTFSGLRFNSLSRVFNGWMSTLG